MRARFPMFIPQRVAIHHSASKRSTRFADVIRWHTDPKPKGNGWPAVGYNHMINEFGNGKPGRIVPQRACAIARANTATLSVLVMGHNSIEIPKGQACWLTHHEDRRWSQTQVDGLVRYLDALFIVWPHLHLNLGGHRDYTARDHPSECPGLDIRKLRGLGWNLTRYWKSET